MPWTRLFPERRRRASMVVVSWTTMHHKEASPMAHMSVLSIDMAEQIVHLIGMDDSGTVVLRKRCPRGALMSCMAQMSPVVIRMEACGGAHDWAQCFRESGYTVKRMAPPCVKPSVTSNTHDLADAEALGEALTRPT